MAEKGSIPSFEWLDIDNDQEYRPYSIWERVKYKFKQDPLIPIGVLATCGALSYGLFAFKKGDSLLQQQMMRARVFFQAFTIGVFAFGTVGVQNLLSNKSQNENTKN